MYDEIFKNFENFEPQEVPTGYTHSYFTYSVKSPLKNWKTGNLFIIFILKGVEMIFML